MASRVTLMMMSLIPNTYSQVELPGYNFEDNLLEVRSGPENGIAVVKLASIPDQISTCFRTNVKFDRFGDQVGYIAFEKEGDDMNPFTQVLARLGVITLSGSTTWKFRKSPEVNNRLKWISYCLTLDYPNNKNNLYINGKQIPNPSKQSSPINGKMSSATNVGLVVRIGHYYFDNKPMIGKMADIHVWSRYLTQEEGLSFSDCSSYVEKSGDLINQTTEWIVNGSLIEKIKVPSEEVLCSPENNVLTLYVHAPFLRFAEAKESCDKYLVDSIVGPFTSNDGDWRRFYDGGNANPAVVNHCWTGGRILHWMPYVDMDGKVDGEYNFTHVVTHQPMGPLLSPWRPKQPNDKKPPLCIYSYLGIGYNASWYDAPCVRDSLEWAACVGCWIPNTFEKSIIINMRGLCPKSRIDTQYQVRNGEDGLISYIGKRNTEIKYLPDRLVWVIHVVNNPNVSGSSEAPMSSLAMGNHLWTIRGDFACNKKDTDMVLSMTTCSLDQFTCDNGLCMDILLRCDGSPDCNDKSDEMDCSKISLDASYQKYIAPPPHQIEKEDTPGKKQKVAVGVSADILKILEINEVSDGLPKTAYVKMIDLWLVFNLLVPFVEVMLHTYMDTLRDIAGDEEGEESYGIREVNKHGKTVKVDRNGKLVEDDFQKSEMKVSKGSEDTFRVHPAPEFNPGLIARDEKKEVIARKAFYNKTTANREQMLKICKFVANIGIPAFAVVFIVVFWIIGLANYFGAI